MQEQPHPAPALPPLLAGKGWGGVALRLEDQKLHHLPTSPCKQGEEQCKSSLTLHLRSLPCKQGEEQRSSCPHPFSRCRVPVASAP